MVLEPETQVRDWTETEQRPALTCGLIVGRAQHQEQHFYQVGVKISPDMVLHTDSCSKFKTQAAISIFSWKTNTVSARCGPQGQVGPASWVQPGVLGTKGMGYSVCWGPHSPGTSPLHTLPCSGQGQGQDKKGLQPAACVQWVWKLSQEFAPRGFCHFKGF